jgi:hypothetical protein
MNGWFYRSWSIGDRGRQSLCDFALCSPTLWMSNSSAIPTKHANHANRLRMEDGGWKAAYDAQPFPCPCSNLYSLFSVSLALFVCFVG